MGSTTPTVREDPIVETQVGEPCGLNHVDEEMNNPIIND
jgi:hypothetical protein